MKIIFRGVGCLTLLFDAYLLLALVAASMMKVEYHWMLPPFGFEFAVSIPRIVYICLVVWTGFLAVGCLQPTNRGEQPEK